MSGTTKSMSLKVQQGLPWLWSYDSWNYN